MIVPLLVATASIGAAVSAWGLPRGGRAMRAGLWVGSIALLAVLVLDFLLAPVVGSQDGTPVAPAGELFGGYLVATSYLRLVVGIETLMAIVVLFVAWLLDGLRPLRGLLPASLAVLAGTTVALGAADLGLGVAAAVAVGLAALLVVLAEDGPLVVAPASREVRVTLVGGAILLAVVEILPVVADLVLRGIDSEAGVAGAGEPAAVMGLLTLAGAGAVGLRYGVLPFHVRVSRLADVVPPISLPLLLAWIPLPLAVVGIAAVDTLVAPLALPLEGERMIVIAVAVATMAGGALAGYVQDDLRHMTGYLVIADAGVLVLAVAALDPAAWGPARAWVVVLAASKAALGAWAAVAEERFGTRSIPDLRGWMRRSPLLAASLVVTTVATFGLPGWVAFEARNEIAGLALQGAGATVLILVGWLTLPVYLRLLVLGAGRVTSKVDGAVPERFVRRERRRGTAHEEQLPVVVEGAVPDDAGPSAGGRGGQAAATRDGQATMPLSGMAAAADAENAEAEGPAVPAEPGEDGAMGAAPGGRRGALGGLRTRTRTAMASASSSLAAAGESIASTSRSGRSAVAARRTRHADALPWRERLSAAVHRDRAELLAGAVLALSLLAALTSWGALDVGTASAEPAPEIVNVAGD